MRRRAFITLVGGAAAVWPLAAHAQQTERIPRVGILLPFAADNPEPQTGVGKLLQELPTLEPRMTVSEARGAVSPAAVTRTRREVLVPLYWVGSFS